MSLSLRIAIPQDVEKIARLVNSAYRGETSRAGWTTEADLLGGQRTDPDFLREEMSHKGRVILVFGHQGKLVGCVSLENRGVCAYLGMLTVAPNLQAAGLGSTILQMTEDWVQGAWGITKIEMTVIKQRTELISWYQRRGYADSGRREAFPLHDIRFGIPKVHDLEMVVLEKNVQTAELSASKMEAPNAQLSTF